MFKKSPKRFTVFENPEKSLIQHCERSELRLYFEWTKVILKCQKRSILAIFWKPEACGKTVLPDRSILIGEKLLEKAKIEKLKCDIFADFQALWAYVYILSGQKLMKNAKIVNFLKT